MVDLEQFHFSIKRFFLSGDVHYYGYGEDSWNFTTYPITRFLSETGVQSLPSLDTWNQVTNNQSDLDFNSSFILHREHKENQMTVMLTHIQTNLPLPVTNDSLKKFTQMIYLSQINQGITLKRISDVCRIHSSKDMIDSKTSLGHTMGFMYWQINDIWQAPTWSTIEYGLKWKLSHYLVRYMFSPVYPVVTLTPYLASITDENAQISLYVVNDLFDGTRGDLICGIHTMDTFASRISFGGDVLFDSAGVQRVMSIPYPLLMKRANCNDSSQCLIHCLFTNNELQVRQTFFLNRPKAYQLSNPYLKIQSITTISATDFNITITADRPALFVWLDTPTNITGYFSKNGFNMFQPVTTVVFHSWTAITNFTLLPTFSLFDVTQP
jgi:beta-mannosidase